MTDRRDYERPWWEVLDEGRMLAYVEGQWVPFRYETCGLCDGRGKHVNPAIDSHGLTAEDFEDPDFREDYFRGVYDVPCNVCGGARVVPVPTTREGEALVYEIEQDRYESHQESLYGY